MIHEMNGDVAQILEQNRDSLETPLHMSSECEIRVPQMFRRTAQEQADPAGIS
jgi:hypothetical protein